MFRLVPVLLGLLVTAVVAGPAFAVCQLVADAPYRAPGPDEMRIWRASLQANEVQIRYIDHSTFELETPKGVRIATDYNDSVRPLLPPDVATMNGAHSTHYSISPDPNIEHLLYGWNPKGGPLDHDVTVDDVRIRNIQTNIRGWDGEERRLGNSIFIFEVAGLCIGHLGHLHHKLTEENYAAIGRLDILMVPVDGGMTMSQEGMGEIAERLQSRIILPMHRFRGPIDRFLSRVPDFDVDWRGSDTITVSVKTLPARPTVIILPGV